MQMQGLLRLDDKPDASSMYRSKGKHEQIQAIFCR
jgi:hypothetical protein